MNVFVFVLFALFFFNDTATTEIYTLSLHDALPICATAGPHRPPADLHEGGRGGEESTVGRLQLCSLTVDDARGPVEVVVPLDRKSTRLNSSHANISYAVFCLKKKTNSYFTH